MNVQELDRQYVAHTYNRFPVTLVKGQGSLVWDETGKEYIDMGTGIGVTAFGYCDPAWVAAVTAQLGRLQQTSNLYFTEPCARTAQLLCLRTGMKKVFFANSGAEANECAVKAARKWAAETKGPEYSTIVTLKNSFHGRTLTTLAATGQEHYHELYRPLTPGFVHSAPDDLEELAALTAQSRAAGILLECVQGEGGVVALSPDFIRGAARIARDNNVLLMVDEVQSGNGRTGKLYSYMHFGVEPDVVTTAKGLGGGLPLGVCLLGERVQDVFAPGDHGSTFGGNPVSCAGAVSVLERIDEPLLASVREKSGVLFDAFTGAPGVRSVSGLGFMVGVEPEKPAADVVKTCLQNGVLCLTAKNKIRLLPALNIPLAQLEKAAAVIRAACAE